MNTKVLWLLSGFLFCINMGVCLGESAGEPLFGSTKYTKVRVERVLKADTFVLESGEKIKMIGLSAPNKPRKKDVQKDQYGFVIEEFDPKTPVEDKAFAFAKELLEGKDVRLEFDTEKKSADYETLAYVYLPDNTFVNAEILRQGFAHLKLSPANNKFEEELRAAYQEARREKRGLQDQ